MAWDFKPFMKVVCVDDSPIVSFLGRVSDFPIPLGAVVNVAEVFERKGMYRGVPGNRVVLDIEGFVNPQTRGFAADRFRPVRTTDISALEAHLNTLPVRTKTEA